MAQLLASVVLAMALVGTAAPPGWTAADVAWLETSRVPGGLLAVEVAINGTGPFRLLLDTGSTRTILTPAAARLLTLEVYPGARVVAPGGSREAGQAWLSRLVAGPLAVERLPVVITALADVQAGDRELDGILGMDVLSRCRMLLDVPAGVAAVVTRRGALPSTAAARRVPLVRDATGRLGVEGALGESVRMWLLDSGASVLTVFGTGDTRHGVAFAATATRRATIAPGVAGLLRLGSVSVRTGPVAWLPGARAGTHDGLLPLGLLGTVVLDPERREIVLLDRDR
ncbi:MAG: retropepsin-like aspartic protease [Vicinamibacterales bacterium]